MTIIQREVYIPAAPAAVFDYVTRPKRWKEWNPVTVAVLGVDDGPQEVGSRFAEQIRSSGLTRLLQWQVKEVEPGRSWVADAYMRDGSRLNLSYELMAEDEGTRFRRTINYEIKPRLLRIANDWLLWRRIARDSERALENLREHFFR